jgi:Putative adhesin
VGGDAARAGEVSVGGNLAICLDFGEMRYIVRCNSRADGKDGRMAHWTIEAPTSLEFDDVTALRVRLVAGSVAVLATDGKPSLDVANVSGDPLDVTYEDGVLTITHENLTWEGLLKWLRPRRASAAVTVTVPRTCPAQVGVVSATAVLSGISARASVKSVSGEITLDGVTGDVEAHTVSAALEAQGINGKLNFNTVSGDLALADGWLERLDVNAVSGDVTADIDLDPLGGMHVTTVSGEVTLRLPAETDAQVHLYSMSGGVRGEFAGLRSMSAPASHMVSGSLGAGSGHVSVNTMSGRVMLLRRAERGTAAQAAQTGPPQPDNKNEMEGEAS